MHAQHRGPSVSAEACAPNWGGEGEWGGVGVELP